MKMHIRIRGVLAGMLMITLLCATLSVNMLSVSAAAMPAPAGDTIYQYVAADSGTLPLTVRYNTPEGNNVINVEVGTTLPSGYPAGTYTGRLKAAYIDGVAKDYINIVLKKGWNDYSGNIDNMALQFYYCPIKKNAKLEVALHCSGNANITDDNNTSAPFATLSIPLDQYLNLVDYNDNSASWRLATIPFSYFRDHGVLTNNKGASFSQFDWQKIAGFSIIACPASGDGFAASGTNLGRLLDAKFIEYVDKPQNITMTPMSTSSVNISWTHPVGTYTPSGYIVSRDGVQIANITTGTSYTDIGLSENAAYKYDILSYYTPKHCTSKPETKFVGKPVTNNTATNTVTDPCSLAFVSGLTGRMIMSSDTTVNPSGGTLAFEAGEAGSMPAGITADLRVKLKQQIAGQSTNQMIFLGRGSPGSLYAGYLNTGGAVQFYLNPLIEPETLNVGVAFATESTTPYRYATLQVPLSSMVSLQSSDYGEGKWKFINIPYSYLADHGTYTQGASTMPVADWSKFQGFVLTMSDEQCQVNDIPTATSVCRLANVKFVTGVNPIANATTSTFNGSSVTLNWMAPLGGPAPTDYDIYKTDAQTKLCVPLANVAAGTSSYTDTNVSAGKDYTYYIQTNSLQANGSVLNSVPIEVNASTKLQMSDYNFTDSSGQTTKKLSAAGASAGVNVHLFNNSGSSKHAALILALYKGEELKQCIVKEQDISPGIVQIHPDANLNLTDIDSDYCVKAFVWDGVNSMTPIKYATGVRLNY